MATVLTTADERLLREFADEFTTQYSQGDPKYVNHQAQSDAVAETVRQYVQTLSSDRRIKVRRDGDNVVAAQPDRAEKWRTWAKLTDDEIKEQTGGGSLFEYDGQLATDCDDLAFELLKIMWAVDAHTWKWITNIPHVDFGDDVFEKARDLENFFKVLFALHP